MARNAKPFVKVPEKPPTMRFGCYVVMERRHGLYVWVSVHNCRPETVKPGQVVTHAWLEAERPRDDR